MTVPTDTAVDAVQAAALRQLLDGGAPVEEDEWRHLVEVSGELLAITDYNGYFRGV